MPPFLESRQTVLILDSDRSTGRHMQACLESAGFRVPRPCTNAMDALAAVANALPDVVVMDMSLLDAPGRAHELLDTVVARRVPVVYLLQHAERATIERAVHEQHAAAVVVRPASDRQLVAEVFMALARAERRPARVDIPPRMTADEKLRLITAIVGDVSPRDEGAGARRRPGEGVDSLDPQGVLSVRERQIVELLGNGARVSTIAVRLQLSPHTVRNHLKSVFRKLNVHGQHELFERWHERGV
ncbi:MAG: LuxR C-terminal-related transcriptional regulator [Vicinamibacterales bacterium]